MGRRRRRTGRQGEELTLEGFGDPQEDPASEPAASQGEPEPRSADPDENAQNPMADAGAGEREEGDHDPSLSSRAGDGEEGVDLPPDPGVLQHSVPPTGATTTEGDGPELAGRDSSQGNGPRVGQGGAPPPAEAAGSTSEIPVQDARTLSIRYSAGGHSPDHPHPGTPLDEIDQARVLVGEGRINAALILLRNSVQADPRNVEARVELGLLLDRTGSHAAAVEHLEAALRGAPDTVQILSALGAAQTSLGRFDEAERELKKAQRLAPEDLLVRAHLAIVSFRRGLYALAEAELRWVCERDEGNATAHFYRGEALNRLGQVDEALDAMKTVARLDPTNSRAFYTMGILYDKKHLPTEAAAMYRRARELGPR